jgi:NTP pyrophosphatase (non-canonical NTP hydrolase)
MTTLEEYKLLIIDLSKSKGWNRDQIWLMYSCYKELGEISGAIEHNLTQEQIAKEFADLMHFTLQLMYEKCPEVNLDSILHEVIKNNWASKKKTYKDGEFVRK